MPSPSSGVTEPNYGRSFLLNCGGFLDSLVVVMRRISRARARRSLLRKAVLYRMKKFDGWAKAIALIGAA